jgi:hypothetical protein
VNIRALSSPTGESPDMSLAEELWRLELLSGLGFPDLVEGE